MNLWRNWLSRGRSRSGQALVEFMLVVLILMVLLFGLIDFSRALSTWQIMINVSREGSNLAARGSGTLGSNTTQVIQAALGTVVSNAAPLNISQNGVVIITAVENSNGTFVVTQQMSLGALTATSKVAPKGTASTPIMPISNNSTVTFPQPNQTTYITEVYYSYSPVTPIGTLVGLTLPSTLYDVAYF